MANYDPSSPSNWGTTYAPTKSAAEIDAGLRGYMLGVYNYMAIGLAITGFAAIGIYMLSFGINPVTGKRAFTSIGSMLFGSPFKYVIMFAPLAFMFLGFNNIDRISVQSAQARFWIFATLIGVSMATILAVYTGSSVARVFFITSATFAGVSIFGYTTKKDLSAMGSFMIMGAIGLMVASLVNVFMQSSALQWAISVLGVLIFAGLTAWDTQRLKTDYVNEYSHADTATAQKSAIFGALSLYLNFVNMFQFLMSLFGDRE